MYVAKGRNVGAIFYNPLEEVPTKWIQSDNITEYSIISNPSLARYGQRHPTRSQGQKHLDLPKVGCIIERLSIN